MTTNPPISKFLGQFSLDLGLFEKTWRISRYRDGFTKFTQMTYTLTKLSVPGWEKTFNTLEEVEKQLSQYVCRYCTRDYGEDLDSMLSSACGCEFMLESDTLNLSTNEENTYDAY